MCRRNSIDGNSICNRAIYDPKTLYKKAKMEYNSPSASLAQLDRVLGFEPSGWGFESLRVQREELTYFVGSSLFYYLRDSKRK